MKLLLTLLLHLPITHSADKYLAFTTDYPPFYDTVGFDWISRLEVFRIFDGQSKSHAFSQGNHPYSVRWVSQPPKVSVLEAGELLAEVELSDLLKKAEEYQASHLGSPLPQALLTAEAKGPRGRLRVYLEALSAEQSGEGVLMVHHLKCDVLFARQEPKAR